MSARSSRNLSVRPTPPRAPFLRVVALGFFVLGCFLLYLASPLSRASLVESTLTRSTLKIEDVQVGQRVWADNPDVETTSATNVDPATWNRLHLRAEAVWDDGTIDDINIATLQSPEWIVRHEARVGATVPIPLDLVEMGLPVDMRAKVLAIERCPAIEAGAGRVVLTTVNHLNRDAYQITVEDAQGRREVSRPTGLHKFYRPTDGQWISAREIQPGDKLRDVNGHAITVVSVQPLPGVHRVYNLTVEGEHVYHVSTLGLLVHNNDCSISIPSKQYQDNWAQAFGDSTNGVRNFRGDPVQIPEGHVMSVRDPDMSAPPIVEAGPFTTAQRESFVAGQSAGTRLSPHHRHQIPTSQGGVIDEIPGPGHSAGNSHTAGTPSRHLNDSIFNSMEGGHALRIAEIRAHWQAKGQRLIEIEVGVWIDPGP